MLLYNTSGEAGGGETCRLPQCSALIAGKETWTEHGITLPWEYYFTQTCTSSVLEGGGPINRLAHFLTPHLL